ncbi:MAG: 4-hydroxy-tetrahydrodipicolinate reductase [Verrucomicrobiota bacterium]|nr:4-hydroxy-tetrahydrodipicolinate reductase [Verrucomicrobiota bacterium]
MSSTVTVAILGAGGRMGQALVRCAGRIGSVKLVAAIERKGHPAVGRDAGVAAGIAATGVMIGDNPRGFGDADVLVDFTLRDAVPANCRVAVENRRAMVIGTTGLNDDEKAAVERAAALVPIVQAPNMSLGVNVLFAMVKKAGEILGSGYRIEIDETHHIHKNDAPSGTALRLGQKAAEGLGRDFKAMLAHDPEGQGKIRADDKLVIRSFRRGEVVGDHTVSFENASEKIEFTHHAWSREAFAMGALRAAEWVVSQRPGLYDMQDVLGL